MDAEVLGAQLARDFVGTVPELPGVVLYTDKQIYLEGPGVAHTDLGGGGDEDDAKHHRYTGLRLLEHTGGRYFLIPDGWSPAYGVVYVIPDDAGLRLDLVRDRRVSAARPSLSSTEARGPRS